MIRRDTLGVVASIAPWNYPLMMAAWKQMCIRDRNITAHYRQMLDAIIEERGDLARASSGRTEHCFVPSTEKTFHRGSTDVYKRQVVVSSHVLDQLGRMATRYGVINEGRMVGEMTADEVTQACGDYLVVRTAEPERTVALLAETRPSIVCTALPDGSLRLQDASGDQGALDAAGVGTLLAAQGIAVYELRAHARDLEDFFLELMGGSHA